MTKARKLAQTVSPHRLFASSLPDWVSDATVVSIGILGYLSRRRITGSTFGEIRGQKLVRTNDGS